MDKDKEQKRNKRKYIKLRQKNKENGCKYVIGTLEARELREQGLKYCPGCTKIKKFKEFNNSKNSNNGYSSHCTLCSRILSKKYYTPDKGIKRYKKHKEHLTSYRLERKFGITLKDYNHKLKEQEGKCMICNMTEEQNGKRFAVDHNHATGKVRDLLCGNCNAAIGFLQENINIVKKAVLYIERWSK